MSDTIRKEFEAHHRVPDDAFYKASVGAYKYEKYPTVDHPFNELWESFCDGWNASRAQIPSGYAGVKMWIGDREITKVFPEHVVNYERESGSAITFAAQSCLNQLAEFQEDDQ